MSLTPRKRKRKSVMLASLLLCLLSASLLASSLGTQQWFTSDSNWAVNGTFLGTGTVNFGLFKGRNYLNANGGRTHVLNVVCLENRCMYSCADTKENREEQLQNIIDGQTVNLKEHCDRDSNRNIGIRSLDGKMPNDTTGKMPKDTTGKMPNDTTGKMPNDTTGKMPNDTTGKIPNDTTRLLESLESNGKVPNDMTGKVPNDMTGKMPNDMTGKVPNDMIGKIPNDMTGKMPNDTTGLFDSLESNGKVPNDMSGLLDSLESNGKVPNDKTGLFHLPNDTTGLFALFTDFKGLPRSLLDILTKSNGIKFIGKHTPLDFTGKTRIPTVSLENSDVNGLEFMSFGLWVGTIACLSAALLMAVIGALFAVVNTVTTPVEAISGVPGLYLWNALAALFSLACVIQWAVQYHLHLSSNVLLYDAADGWTTEGLQMFGYSYWLVVAAIQVHVGNIVIIFLGTWEPRRKEQLHAPETKAGNIMLY